MKQKKKKESEKTLFMADNQLTSAFEIENIKRILKISFPIAWHLINMI